MPKMTEFLRTQGIENAVLSMGSVPHEMFLNILSHSLAYIRSPMTDGVCSSVLESMKLKVPVLATDNGRALRERIYGKTAMWRAY